VSQRIPADPQRALRNREHVRALLWLRDPAFALQVLAAEARLDRELSRVLAGAR
jgi:hypothetical protein